MNITDHITEVQEIVFGMVNMLKERGEEHDASVVCGMEDGYHGSDIHYGLNDHHVEHHVQIEQMNMFQLLEMLADWKVEYNNRTSKNIHWDTFLFMKKTKYKITDELFNIIKHTWCSIDHL